MMISAARDLSRMTADGRERDVSQRDEDGSNCPFSAIRHPLDRRCSRRRSNTYALAALGAAQAIIIDITAGKVPHSAAR